MFNRCLLVSFTTYFCSAVMITFALPKGIVLTGSAITPPTYEYIASGIQHAEEQNLDFIILELDTPEACTRPLGK